MFTLKPDHEDQDRAADNRYAYEQRAAAEPWQDVRPNVPPPKDFAKDLLELAEWKGGFSIRPFETSYLLSRPKSGIMVAEHPNEGLGKVIPLKPGVGLSEARVKTAVRAWVERVQDYVKSQPNLYFGGWTSTDPETGVTSFYLDVSQRLPKEHMREAIQLARQNNQKAIFRLDDFAEIGTGGTGERTTSNRLPRTPRAAQRALRGARGEETIRRKPGDDASFPGALR
jgi:hypothetical protein